MIPPDYETHFSYGKSFFNTGILGGLFPDLTEQFGPWKPLDLQCGFSQTFLKDLIPDVKVSQLRFKSQNKVEFDLGFGCGLFVDQSATVRNMDKSKEMTWVNFISFFGVAEGSIELRFDNIDIFTWISFVLAEIVDYDVNFSHLKMMKYNEVVESREEIVNEYLRQTKEFASSPLSKKFLNKIPVFITPPSIDCLGLKPQTPVIEIQEGFIRVAYDIVVKHIDEKCYAEYRMNQLDLFNEASE